MSRTPALSVVVPLYNEAENLDALCAELDAALGALAFEAVFVDDGSTDDSAARYRALESAFGWLRVVRHPVNAGQSAAFCTGVAAARSPVIATIDGDLQNDPADIPGLLDIYLEKTAEQGPTLVTGNRTQRRDSFVRRLSSRVANRVRSSLLRDRCLDTGCSLKLFSRDAFLLLPQFDHMHRFLPALFARDGAQVVNVPVNHRERRAGASKYGIGNRLWVGIVDLFGTRWLLGRRFRLSVEQRLEPRRRNRD
ncbi:MAG: glycosyltransferase family 2 protein [Pseudomonadota bacterium]